MDSAEAMVQLGMLIGTLSVFFLMRYLRNQKTHPKTRTRNKNHQPELNRHLTQASRHLARARSTSNRSQHARNAVAEAGRAFSISPREPSVHILKARALHCMGHRAAAIRSLDSALSPPAVKSLSPADRVDALFFRAEMKLELNRRRRVDSAIEDLVEAMRVSGEASEFDNSEALCLLGKCYEWKGMNGEARNAFQKFLDIEPDSVEARNGLDRLVSPLEMEEG